MTISLGRDVSDKSRLRLVGLLMVGTACSAWSSGAMSQTSGTAAPAATAADTTQAPPEGPTSVVTGQPPATPSDTAPDATAPVGAAAVATSADTGTNDRGIADIVVTARFRKENLQSTPLSVSAFNASTIQNAVVTDVRSLQKFLPNVQLSRVNYAGQALGASIRGISFADLEKTFDPAIGVAIDGVFLGTNTGADFDFNDLESIEVLRGPQGTLYGRNTIGGTISVRRTRPTGEAGVKINARYGSFNTLDLGGVVNLPKIADVFSIKLFGQRIYSDSSTKNRYTGKAEPGRRFYDFGGTVLADLGNTTVLGTVEYQKDRSRYASAVNLTVPNNLPFGAGGNICDFTMQIGFGDLGCATQGYLKQKGEDYKLANTSIPFKSYLSGISSSLEINSQLGGDFKLTAITGYRDSNDQLLEENTGTPPLPLPGVPGGVPLFVAARDQNYKQLSQEVRVQGDITPWADIVAGVYYLHTKYSIGPYVYNGTRDAQAYFFGQVAQRFTAGQTLDSYAAFAESIFKLGHNIRLTVGGRYTSETKKFHLNQQTPPVFDVNEKKTFSDPTGRAILDWKPDPNTLLYVSWSRGFRSGGFNGRATTQAAAETAYDPERVDSYEAGLKADFLDGRLRFNPAIFLANYDKKQEEILRPAAVGVGTETIVQNAANAQIKGVEFEVQARPVPDLTLHVSGSYLDAKYKKFLIPDIVNGGFVDVSDSRNFRRAPKYSLNSGLDYTHEISDGNTVNFTVDYDYLDKFTTTPGVDPTGLDRDTIAAHTNFDLQLAFIHKDESLKTFRIAGYARDLFHKGNRITNTLDAGLFYFGAISPQREFGIEGTVQF